ncbi:hypothetical protein [Paenibacillus alkalitolerans]|uniref:hypothetical protein n=1 Tax=Paenibacillus alkalitolerans TaxID=2799335 RepID=UPI0018F5E331|nr:hypothetical protein [Paenibacillus alkalitolerans]
MTVIKVDPNKVLGLAEGMQKLNTPLEKAVSGVYKDVSSLVRSTESSYHESHVRAKAASVEKLLSEIVSLGVAIGEKLGGKATALIDAGEEYLLAEQRSQMARDYGKSIIRDWYKRAWDLYQDVGIGLYSWYKGYKFKVNGNYVHVYGARSATGFWDKRYAAWRTREGLTGTRYRLDNSKVAKYLDMKTGVVSKLSSNYNIMNSKAWKNSLKGGGILGAAATMGVSVYDYGWGKHKDNGLASTEFASDLIVETGVMVGTTAASTAIGMGAAAAAGAAFGSVVPGLGTAVGFVAGVGIGLALNTKAGKAATDWAKDKVNKGIEAVGKAASSVIGGIKSLF